MMTLRTSCVDCDMDGLLPAAGRGLVGPPAGHHDQELERIVGEPDSPVSPVAHGTESVVDRTGRGLPQTYRSTTWELPSTRRYTSAAGACWYSAATVDARWGTSGQAVSPPADMEALGPSSWRPARASAEKCCGRTTIRPSWRCA